jgi:hypothetical protein
VNWLFSATVGLSVLAATAQYLTALRAATPAEAVPVAPQPRLRGLT